MPLLLQDISGFFCSLPQRAHVLPACPYSDFISFLSFLTYIITVFLCLITELSFLFFTYALAGRESSRDTFFL